MNRVASEFTVKIVMHLQQRNAHTSPRQWQREHRSSGSASDDAAAFIHHNLSLSCRLHLSILPSMLFPRLSFWSKN